MATPTETDTRGEVDTETETLSLALGALEGAVRRRLDGWTEQRFAERLWQQDPTLWAEEPFPDELTDRLGWLDLPSSSVDRLESIQDFAEEVRAAGYTQAVLLGMGGSSLAPEVFQTVFGNRAGYARLTVLDSTHPAAVRAVAEEVEADKVLFLVASKSGTTVETLSLFRYFWHWIEALGERPGPHFAAITDPGSPLTGLARERGFRRVFMAQPDLGGRYSALSDFGLVPAAVIGVDTGKLLARARRSTPDGTDKRFAAPAHDNTALQLGAVLGEAARAGRDKLTLFASPRIAFFPVWLEQLIAESTGKDGTGILPVVDEPVLAAERYGDDRLFVHLELAGAPAEEKVAPALAALEQAGHPVVRIRLPDELELGAQIVLWEVAVAAAGQVLGIHPFNQPDVELAKRRAEEALDDQNGGDGGGRGEAPGLAASGDGLEEALGDWAAAAKPPHYATIQAFLPQSVETDLTLRALRQALADRTGVATTAGYGPRFLHSTGQLHKGGPDTGLYLQLVDTPADDLPVPETDTSFRALIRAQAVGDDRALAERDRRVLRIELGQDAAGGLARILERLQEAPEEGA